MTTTDNGGGRRISGRLLIAIGLLFNLAVLAIAYVLLIGWPGERQASLPIAIGGPFSMSDQTGRTVSDGTLKGKPYAIFFGYTHCPDVCPTTLGRLAQLRRKLGTDGDRFAIVFVSVDPERDTREALGSYVAMFDTPIVALTGTPQQLAGITKAFRIYHKKVPTGGGDYAVDHTASIFLMDADGQFVTTIDHAESETLALAKLRRMIG